MVKRSGVRCVWDDLAEELRLGLDLVRVGDGLATDLANATEALEMNSRQKISLLE